MRFVFLCAILLLVVNTGIAQSASPTPLPAPTPRPVATPAGNVRTPSAVPRFGNTFPLNPLSESDRLSRRVTILGQYVAPLYRKATSKELEAIGPNSAIRQQYAALTARPGSGIFRLVRDSGCSTNYKVVSAKDECLKYSMPGSGSSYSFRTEGYRVRQLADITYRDNSFHITGLFMHGFIAKVENTTFESVNLTMPGLEFVSEFKPSINADDVHEVDAKLSKGVERDGSLFSKNIRAEKDGIYVLRAVAYRGKVVRSAVGIRYNELDYDKRRDVIVVFRVVEVDSGGVTLVWRKLSDREPPKISMPKSPKEDDTNKLNNANL